MQPIRALGVGDRRAEVDRRGHAGGRDDAAGKTRPVYVAGDPAGDAAAEAQVEINRGDVQPLGDVDERGLKRDWLCCVA
jgi:hypothetical protein